MKQPSKYGVWAIDKHANPIERIEVALYIKMDARKRNIQFKENKDFSK